MSSKIKNYLIIGLVITMIIGFIKYKYETNSSKKETLKLKKELVAKDSTQTIRDGQARRLADIYNNNEKSLRDSVKNLSSELAKEIKDRKENPLIVTKTKITFVEGKGKIVAEQNSDSVYTINSTYPKTKPFIKYQAKLNTKSKHVDESWKFNDMDISMIITEKDNGMWDTYVVGEEFVKIKDIKVNALPRLAEKPKSNKFINLYGGGGVVKMNEKTDLTVNLGATVGKSNQIMISTFVAPSTVLTSKPTVGGGILFKF